MKNKKYPLLLSAIAISGFLSLPCSAGQLGVNSSDGKDLPIGASNTTAIIAGGGETVDKGNVEFKGKIGVGTASPTSPLTISDGGYYGNIWLGKNSATGVLGDLSFDGGSDDTFIINNMGASTGATLFTHAGTTTTMSVMNNGLVGIGTTSPGYPLSVVTTNGNGLIANFSSNSPNRTWFGISNTSGTSSSSSLILGGPSTGATNNWEIGNDLGENGSDSLFIFDRSVGLVRMFFNGDGDVGIGTTSPAYKLEVAGDINASGNVRVGGSPLVSSQWANGGGGIYYGGNVGIGTSSPAYSLHVNGTAYATGVMGALSDLRHKDQVETLPLSGLDVVNKLRPVSFVWKEPKDEGMKGKQIGFIAQEVEKVMPDLVLTEDNDEKTKGLKYNEMIPVLTKAIQELTAINQSQAERIRVLEEKASAEKK